MMKLKILGPSLAAVVAAIALAAAAPAPSGLTINITAPAAGTRIPWHSQAPYAVTVTDDGKSTKFGELPSNGVVLRASYVANADAPAGPAALPNGVAEISRSNCTGCHDFTASSAGPSFAAIARRYSGKPTAAPTLADHIRNGSHGNWGGETMPPHPDMTPAQAMAIASWIVGEAADPAVEYRIGRTGSFRMSAPGKPASRAGMVLSAFYTGPLEAGDNRRSATGRSTVVVHGGP